MSRLRDYLSDLRRYYLPETATRARDAWHRAAGRRIEGARGRIANARAARARQRGRRDLPRRAADNLRSSLPVYRSRINPGTGRPNRDSRALGRTCDAALARMAPRRTPRGRTR